MKLTPTEREALNLGICPYCERREATVGDIQREARHKLVCHQCYAAFARPAAGQEYTSDE